MRGQHYDDHHDQDRIRTEDGILRLRKALSTYRDFGKVNDIWLGRFDNYAMIMVSLFGPAAEPPRCPFAFQEHFSQLSKV